MSEKLSTRDSIASLKAINEYRIDNPGTNVKRVVVKRGTDVIFNDNVSVIAGDYNIYFKVDIIWEDVNFDFKQNGLHGNYSSTYNKAAYNGNILTIYADDSVIEIM